ncbi:MAG: hypothetical protein RBG13Loki_3379 [Promethearchaeota archaeon CR_4]|nr:MAG: hypothetical protein RBG13Loki_3379 [Candidatus Lokiarchaeota archaeon CR_4]
MPKVFAVLYTTPPRLGVREIIRWELVNIVGQSRTRLDLLGVSRSPVHRIFLDQSYEKFSPILVIRAVFQQECPEC